MKLVTDADGNISTLNDLLYQWEKIRSIKPIIGDDWRVNYSLKQSISSEYVDFVARLHPNTSIVISSNCDKDYDAFCHIVEEWHKRMMRKLYGNLWFKKNEDLWITGLLFFERNTKYLNHFHGCINIPPHLLKRFELVATNILKKLIPQGRVWIATTKKDNPTIPFDEDDIRNITAYNIKKLFNGDNIEKHMILTKQLPKAPFVKKRNTILGID